jgi:hypothetical protein
VVRGSSPSGPGPAEGAERRVLIATLADLLVSLALAGAATALTLATVIPSAMARAGAHIPGTSEEAISYLLFPVFEFLLFTPIALVMPATMTGFCLILWLCRRGTLPVRSPGMMLAHLDRATRRVRSQ